MSTIIEIQPLGFPWQTQDPFLFCAYHADAYPKGNDEMGPEASLAGRNLGSDFEVKDGWRMYHGKEIPGFPYHPHRGFETVTIVTEGLVDHADSLGAAGRFGNGDVQWMTAGKGVNHSEMFPLLKKDQANPFELFQIWLNLPKKSKFVDAHFSMLWSENIPVITEQDAQGIESTVRVIAGKFKSTDAPHPTPNSWAADPANAVAIWLLKIGKGGSLTLPKASQEANRSLYFYEGNKVVIEETLINASNTIQVKPGNELTISAEGEDAYLLMLQGKPIKEPVAQYGPFVMNTQREIMEAMNEYQQTQFGGWPWPRPDQVHDREKGRFALFADGHEENP
jgi:redox-sensitive bicupin YhaK (pirin superfamily)